LPKIVGVTYTGEIRASIAYNHARFLSRKMTANLISQKNYI